jgi:hypothetical protein
LGLLDGILDHGTWGLSLADLVDAAVGEGAAGKPCAKNPAFQGSLMFFLMRLSWSPVVCKNPGGRYAINRFMINAELLARIGPL